ncbi:MAG: GDSL-type esterase/lipase family protein [Myxococcota bacterium]|nr:GDSL-type esterase/lipase family protein [Myxococcota bacterium]
MAETLLRPVQPEPFLQGCAWPAGSGVSYPRCDPGPGGLRLPEDTRRAAALPVGVRFRFVGEPESLKVEYRTETADLGYRGPGAGTRFVLFRGERRVDAAPAELGRAAATLRVGPGAAPATLYLPEGMRPTVLSLRPTGGTIRPAPRQPRWLCYGDSIAEGWCASEPAAAWPHQVARACDLDVVNLGYAGAARGEIPSAQEIASLPADLITVAHGTNCWTRTPASAALFGASLAAFLETIRGGHPDTPIVAISPILRSDAETVPNALGARLSDLREVFEATVRERQDRGDTQLHLVPGRDLIGAVRLPDGIHPDDAGHTEMARQLGPVHAAALSGEAPQCAPETSDSCGAAQ